MGRDGQIQPVTWVGALTDSREREQILERHAERYVQTGLMLCNETIHMVM